MRVKKTKQADRGGYRYPVTVEDGRGGYKTTYNVIKPGEDGVTEVMIKSLHAMDDHEVYSNAKNGHPPMTEEQKAEKKRWEEEHPGERYQMNWNLSLDYIAGEDDEEVDKSSVLASASYNPFSGDDISDEVMKLREIVAKKMTDRQREAYRYIGLEGYSITDAAKMMGVSIKVAKNHYDKAIACIRKNF